MDSSSNSPIKVLITSESGRKCAVLVPRGDDGQPHVTISDLRKAIAANCDLALLFDVNVSFEIFDTDFEEYLAVLTHTPIEHLAKLRVAPVTTKPSAQIQAQSTAIPTIQEAIKVIITPDATSDDSSASSSIIADTDEECESIVASSPLSSRSVSSEDSSQATIKSITTTTKPVAFEAVPNGATIPPPGFAKLIAAAKEHVQIVTAANNSISCPTVKVETNCDSKAPIYKQLAIKDQARQESQPLSSSLTVTINESSTPSPLCSLPSSMSPALSTKSSSSSTKSKSKVCLTPIDNDTLLEAVYDARTFFEDETISKSSAWQLVTDKLCSSGFNKMVWTATKLFYRFYGLVCIYLRCLDKFDNVLDAQGHWKYFEKFHFQLNLTSLFDEVPTIKEIDDFRNKFKAKENAKSFIKNILQTSTPVPDINHNLMKVSTKVREKNVKKFKELEDVEQDREVLEPVGNVNSVRDVDKDLNVPKMIATEKSKLIKCVKIHNSKFLDSSDEAWRAIANSMSEGKCSVLNEYYKKMFSVMLGQYVDCLRIWFWELDQAKERFEHFDELHELDLKLVCDLRTVNEVNYLRRIWKERTMMRQQSINPVLTPLELNQELEMLIKNVKLLESNLNWDQVFLEMAFHNRSRRFGSKELCEQEFNRVIEQLLECLETGFNLEDSKMKFEKQTGLTNHVFDCVCNLDFKKISKGKNLSRVQNALELFKRKTYSNIHRKA